jgi:hypothetical protein
MSRFEILAFVVWGGGLFNVGFIAGWYARRRILRRWNVAVKGSALRSEKPPPPAAGAVPRGT